MCDNKEQYVQQAKIFSSTTYTGIVTDQLTLTLVVLIVNVTLVCVGINMVLRCWPSNDMCNNRLSLDTGKK